MILIKLTEEDIVAGITGLIQRQEDGVVYGIPVKTSVFAGNRDGLNIEYCQQNDINIFSFGNEGGVIVVSEGDFDIGYITKNIEEPFNEKFMKYLIEYLSNKGLNVFNNGNDLMIDGIYKAGGSSSRRYGNVVYHAFHISINVNLEQIQTICLKPMSKIPKGLSEYGIITEDIERMFLDFIRDKYND